MLTVAASLKTSETGAHPYFFQTEGYRPAAKSVYTVKVLTNAD